MFNRNHRTQENVGDILSLASEHILMQPAGRNRWVGKCPAGGPDHNDAKSFMVNPKEGLFYCFVCKRSGGTSELERLLQE